MLFKRLALLCLALAPAVAHGASRSFESTRYPAFGSLRYDTRLSNTPRYDVTPPPPVPELQLPVDGERGSAALRAAREALASIRSLNRNPTLEGTKPGTDVAKAPLAVPPRAIDVTKPPIEDCLPVAVTSDSIAREQGIAPSRSEDPLLRCLSGLIEEARRQNRIHPDVDTRQLVARSLSLLGIPLNTPLDDLDDAGTLARSLRQNLAPEELDGIQTLASAMAPRS